jgi:DNA repair protein RadD
MKPRLYQTAAIDAAILWVKYKDSPAIIVLPTGGGKTIVIKELSSHFATQSLRVLILAHRKELLLQAGDKFGDKGFSYYSAAIEKGNLDDWVVIAGIQSIYDADCAQFDIIIVDECHRMPETQEGMYWNFIKKHKGAKIIGLTATPYRLETGQLKWGRIIYDIPYKTLLDAGYLCKLANKVAAQPLLKEVKISMGDYSESHLEDVMTEAALLKTSIEKTIQYSEGRKSVLIFCVTVRHAELLCTQMRLNGLDATIITGKTSDNLRDDIVESFKTGQIRYLINCMVLLEGFDAPDVDMIVCLRPTKSRALWWQMMGRGVRIGPNKKDCLLIDMAGNLEEHGGMGAPFIDTEKKEKAPGKICPQCEEFVDYGCMECPGCGFQFPRPEYEERKINHKTKHETTVDAVYAPQPDVTYDVIDVGYYKHVKKATGSISLRVDYYCEGANYGKISEWIAPFKARDFFADRGMVLPLSMSAETIDEIVMAAEGLKKPEQILVKQEGQWQRVAKYIWLKKPEEEQLSLEDLLCDNIPF